MGAEHFNLGFIFLQKWGLLALRCNCVSLERNFSTKIFLNRLKFRRGQLSLPGTFVTTPLDGKKLILCVDLYVYYDCVFIIHRTRNFDC